MKGKYLRMSTLINGMKLIITSNALRIMPGISVFERNIAEAKENLSDIDLLKSIKRQAINGLVIVNTSLTKDTRIDSNRGRKTWI